MYASVVPAHADVPLGQTVELVLSVGNTSDVIDGFTVRVFGLDASWVTMTPPRLSLFPGDTGTVAIQVRLPESFPAGLRQVSVHVQSENDPAAFELTTVTLNVGGRPRLSLAVDPSQVTGGSTAQFGLVVTNHGNSIVDVIPDALDPEDLAEFEFAPVSAHLLPGEQAVFRAEVKAPRPWVGQPAVRTLSFAACAPEKVESMATFVQRPRISRWLLSLLGLITAAAVFAAVLSRTLSGVVDEAKVSDALVNEALANGQGGGERVSTRPATVTGKVVSATSNTGVAGVQAQLFRDDNAEVAVASAATGSDGQYAFGRLSGGTYRIKFSGAGFAELWFENGRTFAEATDVSVPAGESATLPDVVLGGDPGSVAGRVIAADVTGATARLVVPSVATEGGTAQVATVDVSADGTFLLPNLPTPATYQLVVERTGNATETRTVVVGPGEAVEGLEIRLRDGNGVISGHVSAGGQRLGGVEIEATDGSNTVSTVSITDGDVGGFVIRGLAVPGRYTVTFSRDGFMSESRTVAIDSGDPVSIDVNLSSSLGSISGTVNALAGGALGGVSVTVTGGAEPIVTSTISQGASAGTWSVDALPAPGSYTVTFARAGYVSQTRLVNLTGSGGATTGIDAALVRNTATVRGQVLDASGQARPLATVELTDGVTTRTVKAANDPPGSFGLTGVLPGSYTLTVSDTGATPVVQVVTVQAGDVRDLTIQLGRQAALVGRVVRADGSPYPGLQVRLHDPSGFPSTSTNLPTAITGADGSYSFTGITAPADYVVAVYASPSAVDALDAELVSAVPGTEVVVPDFVISNSTSTTSTTSTTTTTTSTTTTTTTTSLP